MGIGGCNARREERGGNERGRKRKGSPSVGSHKYPISEILKNTLIAELISLAGAATQTFTLGGKYPRAATAQLKLNLVYYNIKI